MLVGLIVRTKQKRPSADIPPHISSGKKSRVRPEDEPYEPPGIEDIVAGEPDTPSPITTPKPATKEDKSEPLLDSEGNHCTSSYGLLTFNCWCE